MIKIPRLEVRYDGNQRAYLVDSASGTEVMPEEVAQRFNEAVVIIESVINQWVGGFDDDDADDG